MKSDKIAEILQRVGVILVYIILWSPILLLVIMSFSQHAIGIRWQGFTTQWYVQVFNTPKAMEALQNSLFVSAVATVVSTIGGTLGAYGLYKYKFRGRGALRMSFLLPIMIPYVVTAATLLIFFTQVIRIPLGYISIIIAHITFSAPLAVFIVLGRMARVDWTLEEASADLGAGKLTTWRKVIAPVLLPAIMISAALIFPWSFNDFTITYFVAGVGTTTLPIYIFSLMQYSRTPVVINAISSVFVILPIIGLLLVTFLQRKEAT